MVTTSPLTPILLCVLVLRAFLASFFPSLRSVLHCSLSLHTLAGSCWAFASAGAAADRICSKGRLSELDLLCNVDMPGGMCDGGYTKDGMNYITNTGIEKEDDFDYPWYTSWGFAKPNKKRCSQKVDKRFKLDSTTMDGDKWEPLSLSEGRSERKIYLRKFVNPGGHPLTILTKDLVKEVIYKNGPVPISMNVFHSFDFHGAARWDYWRNPCKGKLYSHDKNHGSCCHKELKKDCWGWWCKDNSKKCNAADGAHAMKLIGWGTQGGQEYWLIENSWGRGWHESGTFKMRINNNGLTGYWGYYVDLPVSNTRRALQDLAEEEIDRHLRAQEEKQDEHKQQQQQQQQDGNKQAQENGGHRRRRRRLQEHEVDALHRRLIEDNTPPGGEEAPPSLPGQPITVPTDRWDVVELAQAAMGCGVGGADGSTPCNSTMGTDENNAYAGYQLKRVLQSTSQVVQGKALNLVIEVLEEKTNTPLLMDVRAVTSPIDNTNYTIYIRYAEGTADDYLQGKIKEEAWSQTDTILLAGVGGGVAGTTIIVLAALRYIRRKRQGGQAAEPAGAGLEFA